ncbi:Hypothetical predicted protein [Xyrichtys novacula]|uniref:Uncharacterized protein n=1 Tax=Xyrichtys novacula TaxID=13765 RepID=A0AAV1FE98_XYRNO|nr:Hypothetical predicted protein [Xyrichtys novacula]
MNLELPEREATVCHHRGTLYENKMSVLMSEPKFLTRNLPKTESTAEDDDDEEHGGFLLIPETPFTCRRELKTEKQYRITRTFKDVCKHGGGAYTQSGVWLFFKWVVL